MLRQIAMAFLVPSMLAAWTGIVQAEPRLVYTRHTLKLDVHDLDLAQPADLRVLEDRLQQAADRVCGGNPARGDRYTKTDLKRLQPAYEQCRADAVQHALAQIPASAKLANAAATP